MATTSDTGDTRQERTEAGSVPAVTMSSVDGNPEWIDETPPTTDTGETTPREQTEAGPVPAVTTSSVGANIKVPETPTGATGDTEQERRTRAEFASNVSSSEADKERLVFTHMPTNVKDSLQRCAKMLEGRRLSYQQWCSLLQSFYDVSGQNLAGSLETAVKAIAGDQFENMGAHEMKPVHTKTAEGIFDTCKIQATRIVM